MDEKIGQTSQHEQVRQLCNSVLYVLTHSFYRGEDAHLVELSKQFIKELKKDVELRIESDAKAATEAANTPLNKPVGVVSVEAIEAK